MYLSPDDFHTQYSCRGRLHESRTADVYASGDHVVKVYKYDDEPNAVDDWLTEMAVLASLDHPGIIKIVAWSREPHERRIRLAYRRGGYLVGALRAGAVSLIEIGIQILEIMTYCHDIGLAQCDVKPDNLVWLDNRVVLIDFAGARRVISTTAGPLIIGTAYTPGYLDPEYHEDYLNPLSVELYALGRTLYSLHMKATNQEYPVEVEHSSQQKYWGLTTGIGAVDDIIHECLKFPAATRLTARQLFTRITGSALPLSQPTIVIPAVPAVRTDMTDLFREMVPWLSNYAKVPWQAVFNGLAVFRQVVGVLVNHDRKKVVEVCLMIAGTLYQASFDERLTDEYLVIADDIMIALEGRFFMLTPWDFAHTPDDFPSAYFDMARETYDPALLPELTLCGETQKMTNFSIPEDYVPSKTYFHEAVTQPVPMSIELRRPGLEEFFKTYGGAYLDKSETACLLANRAVLDAEPRMAEIYYTLKQSSVGRQIIDVLGVTEITDPLRPWRKTHSMTLTMPSECQ